MYVCIVFFLKQYLYYFAQWIVLRLMWCVHYNNFEAIVDFGIVLLLELSFWNKRIWCIITQHLNLVISLFTLIQWNLTILHFLLSWILVTILRVKLLLLVYFSANPLGIMLANILAPTIVQGQSSIPTLVSEDIFFVFLFFVTLESDYKFSYPYLSVEYAMKWS